jgi:hypothetical protein
MPEPHQDSAPRRIGERAEDGIQPARGIVNHKVKCARELRTCQAACEAQKGLPADPRAQDKRARAPPSGYKEAFEARRARYVGARQVTGRRYSIATTGLACSQAREEAMFRAESLARLWQAQGRGKQAHELLTSVHGQIAMASVSRI